MFMFNRFILISLFLMAIMPSAFAETVSTSSEQWRYGEFVISDEVISHCAIGTNFSNGTSLVLALVKAENDTPKIMIAIGIKDAQLQAHKMHNLKLSLDYKPFPPLRIKALN